MSTDGQGVVRNIYIALVRGTDAVSYDVRNISVIIYDDRNIDIEVVTSIDTVYDMVRDSHFDIVMDIGIIIDTKIDHCNERDTSR